MARPKKKPVQKHVKRKYVRKAKPADFKATLKNMESRMRKRDPIKINQIEPSDTKGEDSDLVSAFGGAQWGYAAPSPDYYQTKPHIVALQREFGGVWIRADGAFRSEEFGVRWAPGDGIPSQNYEGDRKFYGPRGHLNPENPRDAKVMFDSIDFNRRGAELTLAQLSALVNYVKKETHRE